MRYNELKTNGQIINEQWKIDEILLENKFSWVVNAEIQNARLEIINGTLVWNAGIWYNGNWEFGVFRDGEWKYGTWENGVWYNGKWKDGIFKSGLIFNGIFVKGQFLGGEIRGGKFIDCDISPRVKEYVPGEKQQEVEDLQEPVIEPVQVRTDLHVVVKENNQNEMSKIKKFKSFLNEEQDIFKKRQTEIAKKTLKMPDAMANVMGGPTKKEAEEFLKSQKASRKKKKKIVKESTGDLQNQFVGNGMAQINVKQIEGGIEMSSTSKTDIYNLKQTHGGEVVLKDDLYILYIKDKKFEAKIINEGITIVDDFFNKLVRELEKRYFPNVKYYRDDKDDAAVHYAVELFNNGVDSYDMLISKLSKYCKDTKENIESIVKEFIIFEKKINETIFPEQYKDYADAECSFTYDSLQDFEQALRDFDGSYDTKNLPWGDLMCIGGKKYLLTEYGGFEDSYMIFTNIDNDNDYFHVNYTPKTSNAGKPTTPFRFYDIEDYTE